jgi:hypothetical protein
MARVWIDEGCIQCGWCENLEPRVFIISELGCSIVADCREDGLTDHNRERLANLREGVLDAESLAYLPFIAGGCPAEVIRLSGIDAMDDPLRAREAV